MMALPQSNSPRSAGERFLIWAVCLAVVLCFAACEPAFAEKNDVDTGQLPDGSFIYEAKIADLSANNTYYDKQTVQITGEVVGDRINDESNSSYCWITVSAPSDEDAGSIQVLVSKSQADLIDTYGRYGVTGSTVRIMGTFHANCASDEGLEDIHATDLVVVEPGRQSSDSLDVDKLVGGALLVVLGAGLYFAYHRFRARAR